MSIGDIRIYAGSVTDYWGWEVSMDNSETGRKVGGWASSRDEAYSDAMNVLRLDGETWPWGAEIAIDPSRNVWTLHRDLTACRSELASISLLMQERGRLSDLGGPNFALVAGAVTEYVIAMELAVIALNEDRNDMLVQIGGLNNLLACDDDCYHAPMCVRWEHSDSNDPNVGRYPCDCAQLNIVCPCNQSAGDPNDPNIT